MRVFLDANVLVSVLNHEYPTFTYSSRVLSLFNHSRFGLYTSPVALAIAFYYAEKKNRSTARSKIGLLAGRLHITNMHAGTIAETIKNKQVHDFEDGLQYYSALESGCKVIVTEDGKGFYYSEIEVLTSRQFMEKYLF